MCGSESHLHVDPLKKPEQLQHCDEVFQATEFPAEVASDEDHRDPPCQMH